MNEVTAWQWGDNQRDEVDSKKMAIDKGMKIYDLTEAEKAEWSKFFRPVHKDYESVVGKEVFEKLYALEAKYRK